MGEYLFDKSVDQSLLKSGLTIPKEQDEKLCKLINVTLEKGEKEKIKILIEGIAYEATC